MDIFLELAERRLGWIYIYFGLGGYIYVAYVPFCVSWALASHPGGGLASKKFLQPTGLTPFLSRQESVQFFKKIDWG